MDILKLSIIVKLDDGYTQSILAEQKKGSNEGEKKSKDHMISILGNVARLFEEAIQMAFPEVENISVVVMPTPQEKYGDYQCNSAMNIAQVSSGSIVIVAQVTTKCCDCTTCELW